MNLKQERTLTRIIEDLADLRAELGDLATELEASFDKRSERWQNSEAGEKSQGEIDAIREAEENCLTSSEGLEELA